jgi:hypothetical protein
LSWADIPPRRLVDEDDGSILDALVLFVFAVAEAWSPVTLEKWLFTPVESGAKEGRTSTTVDVVVPPTVTAAFIKSYSHT